MRWLMFSVVVLFLTACADEAIRTLDDSKPEGPLSDATVAEETLEPAVPPVEGVPDAHSPEAERPDAPSPEDEGTDAGAPHDEREEDISPPGDRPVAQLSCHVQGREHEPNPGWLEVPRLARVVCTAEVDEERSPRLISRYHWTLQHQHLRGDKTTEGPAYGFNASVPGEYRVGLRVEDSRGHLSGPLAFQVIYRMEDLGGLMIMLTWRHDFRGFTDAANPQNGGCGADLDLHVLREGADRAGWYGSSTVYWQNRMVNWPGSTATLDIDVIRGTGPEIVYIDRPQVGEIYRVAGHVFNDAGFGPAYATVEIFSNGISLGKVERALEHTNAWWDAAAIEWTADGPEVGLDPTFEHRAV